MFKVNIKDTRRHWRHSGVFIVNFEHISHLVSIAEFEHVNAGWVSNFSYAVVFLKGK